MGVLFLKRVRLFVVVDEGIEFPSTNSSVGLAVGGDMMSGFEVGSQLGFGLGRSQVFELGVGKLEGG